MTNVINKVSIAVEHLDLPSSLEQKTGGFVERATATSVSKNQRDAKDMSQPGRSRSQALCYATPEGSSFSGKFLDKNISCLSYMS